MFDRWLKLPAHYYLRVTALVIMAVGVCLHNTLMSIGAIWIIANWLIEAKFSTYWEQFKKTPSLWFLLALLVLSFLSLLWSDDVAYGMKDLARKLPFFTIILAVGAARRIDQKVFHFILFVFLGTLLITSIINYYRYNFVIEDPSDIREMSFFISHVRYSTLTVLGAFTSLFLLLRLRKHYWLWILFLGWFSFYTLKSQILNGYVLLLVLSGFTVIYLILKLRAVAWRVGLVSLVVVGLISIGWTIKAEQRAYKGKFDVNPDTLEQFTASGRPYMHDLESLERENGNLIWIYVQPEEVEKEWNKRSEIDYKSLDKDGQPMFGTILRYMTSKGIRKDSVGVWSLTDEEIKKIEHGVTSVAHNKGVKTKLREFFYQWDMYQAGGDPNGHSLLQRMEHLRAAAQIISTKGFIGVGIGDVPKAFNEAYDQIDSQLIEENRHRSHNQFMTFWVSHGILGVLLFAGLLLAPVIKGKADYFSILIFLSLTVSCLFQDLLETQAGVTLFGLFYVLAFYREEGSGDRFAEREKISSLKESRDV